MQLSDFKFELPEELIAQSPLKQRSGSRLMVLADESPAHHRFTDLPDLLAPGDRLIFNNTSVIPARLRARKASGGQGEVFVERLLTERKMLAKVRMSKAPKPGSEIQVGDAVFQVVERRNDLFVLTADQDIEAVLNTHGEVPLPPYIQRAPDSSDQQRYQCVYAKHPGAVAAPTAGLHFDEPLLARLADRGVTHSFVTLHVGAGTFAPVRVETVADHVMHAERVDVSAQCVEEIVATQKAGGRIIAVGTTAVRSLEAAAASGQLKPLNGETSLFITPGSRFQVIDGMITNFHLSESTLLMLVCAFAGTQRTLGAYRQAVQARYRFFSYGDAMLVWPESGAFN